MRACRKSEAQTPAPIEDRIYGSSKNAPNTATRSNADKIILSEGIENTLRAKLEVFLKDNPDQKGTITLSDLKAVFRRGAGAYSKSHRPTITGGVPNSRNAWAYARVNKFLQKAGGMKVKKAYIQDDDLMKYEDGGLIAPNGKKSNLTPEQYKLVRTKAFKDWFGDWENDPENSSKVVDENGEPLVCYHSTSYEWWHYTTGNYIFDSQKEGGITWLRRRKCGGIYFTNSFLTSREFGKYTLEVFLNLKDPIIVDAKGKPMKEMYFIENTGCDDLIIKNTIDTKTDYAFKENWMYCNVYATIHSKNIKFADGSNTTFDGSNPDIRFEDGGKIPVFGSVENSPYRGFTEEEVMAYDFPEIYKIAEKHHMGSKTIHTEFIKGVFHEQEHTSDWGLSAHTSLQHLWEVPDYYTKLDAVKLAKGGNVKQGKGDCYQTSGGIAIDGGIKGIEFVGKPYVVHAEVRGQGDLMGVRFGHSWVEDDEFVYDYSNGKDLKIPKFFYYYLGDIQKVEPKYYRYTFAQAKKKMLESGHFGSWELETESGL